MVRFLLQCKSEKDPSEQIVLHKQFESGLELRDALTRWSWPPLRKHEIEAHALSACRSSLLQTQMGTQSAPREVTLKDCPQTDRQICPHCAKMVKMSLEAFLLNVPLGFEVSRPAALTRWPCSPLRDKFLEADVLSAH